MELKYQKELIQLSAFTEVLQDMEKADAALARNIDQSLQAVIEASLTVLKQNRATNDQLKVALLQQQILIQAHSAHYLGLTENITQKQNNLWKFHSHATDLFFNSAMDLLAQYFLEKKQLIHRELEEDGSWYSGIRDTAKKSGSLINMALKGANDLAKNVTGSRITEKDEWIDDQTIVEKCLSKHLEAKRVSKEVGQFLDQTTEIYKNAWKAEIQAQQPDLHRISAYSLSKQAHEGLQIDFKMGAAEQTLFVGIGSAVAGTIGLAAGWHTLTYAILNVFPPIAFFAAALSIVTGIATKDHAVRQRKKQIDEAIQRYYHYFLTYLDVLPLKELGDISLRVYINATGEKIILDTTGLWEKSYFGGLTTEHYKRLNLAFTKHLLYIHESLEELEKEI